jgi:hypothetical protein
MAPDTRTILARAIPDRHEVVAAFLTYLLGVRAQDAAPDVATVAERLSQWHDPADLPALFQEVDALLIAGRRAGARQIWINLGYADPSETPVYHPDFGPPRTGRGFDWWLIQNPGVTHVSLDTPPAHRVLLSGKQPEACELLRQYVELRTGKRYLLRWESRGIGSGIAWRAGAATAPLRPSEDWTPGQLPFVAAQDSGVIALIYNRPIGEPRAEGAVELRHIAIEAQ